MLLQQHEDRLPFEQQEVLGPEKPRPLFWQYLGSVGDYKELRAS